METEVMGMTESVDRIIADNYSQHFFVALLVLAGLLASV